MVIVSDFDKPFQLRSELLSCCSPTPYLLKIGLSRMVQYTIKVRINDYIKSSDTIKSLPVRSLLDSEARIPSGVYILPAM